MDFHNDSLAMPRIHIFVFTFFRFIAPIAHNNQINLIQLLTSTIRTFAPITFIHLAQSPH